MNPSHPTPLKAVLCAVYGTLLERGLAPADADSRWTKLWLASFDKIPRLSLADFNHAADMALQTDRIVGNARGIEVPAPYWPAIAASLLPELTGLDATRAADFLYNHAQLRRTVQMRSGADHVLRELDRRGVLLGLISNGHPHTPVELAQALHAPCKPVESFLPAAAAHGVFHTADAARELEIFTAPLCFWSFSHGFGKPNPHVFQQLWTRLSSRGIDSHEVLFIGDNEDGDLKPARKFGWRTWLVGQNPQHAADSGDWDALATALGIAPVK